MKPSIHSSLFKSTLILVSWFSGAFINIITWLVIAGKFGFSSEQVPLHFNIVYGIDFVGSARLLYQIPAAGLAILGLNTFLSKSIYQKNELFASFLIFVSLFVQVLLFVAALAISSL